MYKQAFQTAIKVVSFEPAICCHHGRRRNYIVLVVFPHFAFVFPLHDVIRLNMIQLYSTSLRHPVNYLFSYSTLWRHSVEYSIKTPYLVSHCEDMTIWQVAVSKSKWKKPNFLPELVVAHDFALRNVRVELVPSARAYARNGARIRCYITDSGYGWDRKHIVTVVDLKLWYCTLRNLFE